MQIAKAAVGAILLLVGREINFLFAATMAALLALRLSPSLPAHWPGYSAYIFIAVFALIAAAIPIMNKRSGYFLSGFLSGGYFLVEYLAPGASTLHLLPFFIGGIVGSLIVGFLTEWAMIIVSCLVGAYYVTTLFVLTPSAEILVGAGLFLIGGVTQAIIMRMQKNN